MVNIGDRCGSLTVVNIINTKQNIGNLLEVKCDCGNPKKVLITENWFSSKKFTNCGDCITHYFTDLTGNRYGRLLVLGRDLNILPSRDLTFWCKCDCGKYKSIRGYELTSKRVDSCGCLTIERRKQLLNQDLTNKRFGNLVVIERTKGKTNKKYPYWLCQCDCGNKCVYNSYSLLIMKKISCGCKEIKINPTDLINKKFGKLTILSIIPNPDHKWGGAKFLCQCDCGNKCEVLMSNLLHKDRPTKSCGCLSREITSKRSIKHGLHGTRIYNIWSQMKRRCYRKEDDKYYCYGARGIRVCDEWLNDVVKFKDWALANGYRDDLTIDRIDSNGNYCPENCRWIPLREQAWNKTNTIRLSDGRSLYETCVKENLDIRQMHSFIKRMSPDDCYKNLKIMKTKN